jgi:Leucine-rich repeat (LRR) protein
MFFSCSTHAPVKSTYNGYYSDEELREMRENGRAKAKAYFEELEKMHPDSVEMLELSWAYLDSLPDISKYNKVWMISFSGNETPKVDKSLFSSDSLTYVNLDRCGIRKIDFPKDNHIEDIRLTNNKLKRIPSSIRHCKHLRSLNLEGNQIRHIPRWLLELDSLEDITLNFNQLKLRKSDIRYLAKAKQILLAGNGIEQLPDNVGLLCCENMNLAKNKLHSLPPSFAQLKRMKSLIFYENNFEEIPEVLADFKALKHLDFYKNSLHQIPDFVGDMDGLQQLFLSFNKIEKIPDTLRNLKQLKYFYIHHNELHFLPEWITEMDSIERLGVGFNHLVELPDLSKMKSLRDFDCEHNLLERFPWELVEKPDMEMINARDNDFNLSDEEKMRLIKASKILNLNY